MALSTGLIGAISQETATNIVLFAILPTAFIPVSYFLVAYGIRSKDSKKAKDGIVAALTIFGINLAIYAISFRVLKMLLANNMQEQAELVIPIEIGASIATQVIFIVVAQIILNKRHRS